MGHTSLVVSQKILVQVNISVAIVLYIDTFKHSSIELGPSRTKQSYKNSVNVLAMNQGLADVDGVYFDSV